MTALIAFAALAALLVVVARGLSARVELVVALVCAGVVLVTGALHWSPAADMLRDLGPTLGFLAAVFVIGEVAATAGLLGAVGGVVERRGRSARSLVVAIALTAAAVTVVLSLDTTAVLFTPVVIGIVRRRRGAANPGLLTSVQMTNASSCLLPVSNLTNLLVFPVTGLSFAGYAVRMALPTVVAVAVVTWVGARGAAPEANPGVTPIPTTSLDGFAIGVAVAIGAVLAGFLASSAFGIEPVWVAAGGAVILGVAALASGHMTLRDTVTALAPGFLLFVVALSLVVAAADAHGVADAVDHLLPDGSGFLALAATVAIAALLANLLNNLPATLLLLTALPAGAVPQLLAVLVGVNIGPNATYTGSLATLLWRREVRRAELEPPPRSYYRMALVATPMALTAATVALWLTLRVV